jgi:hypothetical protein
VNTRSPSLGRRITCSPGAAAMVTGLLYDVPLGISPLLNSLS